MSQSEHNKNDLIKRLLASKGVSSPSRSIQPRSEDVRDLLPLSFSQEALWCLNRFDPDNVAYNTMLPLQLKGELDIPILELCLREIVHRHEILRTKFPASNGCPHQCIDEDHTFSLTVLDFEQQQEAKQQVDFRGLIQEVLETPFDLEAGPLFRARLIRLAKDDNLLSLSMHHIIADALSLSILLRELGLLYDAFKAGKKSPFEALPVQYADYAMWQRQWLQGDNLQKQLEYWRQKLDGVAALELPTDHARPSIPGFRAVRVSKKLSKDSSDSIKEMGRRKGVSLFMSMMSIFQILMHKYSGQDDIVIGTPVTMRVRPELKDLMGMFVNMAVIRADMSGLSNFSNCLDQTRNIVAETFNHLDVPFEKLVQELQIQRTPSRNPVFQVTFTIETGLMAEQQMAGLSVNFVEGCSQLTRFDIEATVRDDPDGLLIQFAGNADLFDQSTLSRMLCHYQRILEVVTSTPYIPLTEIPLLTDAESKQQLFEWNQTATEYPQDNTVHELFEAQVTAAPDAIAVNYQGETLSYQQLNERANRLAHTLRKLGVGPDVMVGLFFERSVEMIVGLLGILKAGGAFVPLDLDYPPPRISFMLEDARVPVLLTMSNLKQRLPDYAGERLCLDTDWPAIEQESAINPDDTATADSLAYVIYTSGSTGTPKGVEIIHRAINSLVCNTDFYQVDATDRIAQASNVSFDAATFELWGALVNGAQLIGINKDVLLNSRSLASFLEKQQITAMFITTALFNQVVREVPDAFKNLRGLMFGGEAVDPNVVRTVIERGAPERLIHVYGPTESTTFATWYQVKEVPVDAITVPIGRPLANTTIYVLDRNMNPVPVGVSGELYIGGDGLARGYLNRPELSAEKFVADPFSFDAKAKLYCTGDCVRYRENGMVEFIGRIDHQVKIRGFRIELGEIEALLAKQEQVKHVSVIMREDVPGEKRLVAYVVVNKGSALTSDTLRQHVRVSLPDYMVPSAFVLLDTLPLTPNGKVDRAALPIPQQRQVEGNVIAPRGELEQRIADIWRELLHHDEVGIRDNFFDLGGHSLLLIEIQARLSEELDQDISVLDLFEYPTIESLARHLGGGEQGKPRLEQLRDHFAHRQARTGARQPIAIIGMAGRFPDAADIEALWSLLREGKEAIHFFNNEEMLEAGVPESMLTNPDYVAARGYLDNADKFDASFFGYSAKEAESMDPQQRLLLECTVEVLERAGYDPERYQGYIGVYAGSSMNTYQSRVQSHSESSPAGAGLNMTLGNSPDFVATRLSYKLNLRGPGITIQTACSTSLVAVHSACRGLMDYECDVALAGGVSVTVPTKSGHIYIEEGIGSMDGHCRAFDAGANGTVGGNGVAMVALKRLDEALADGDHIHAVICGSAINNDGSSKVGFTAPSLEGQAEVITMAQLAANCEPDSISYIEAHGTGTLLGDPIEVAALMRAFGDVHQRQETCWLGSLKTNLGHLDAAAGVSGLIKTALSLEHQEIVPSLNYQNPNPGIDFEHSPFSVNTELRKWESPQGTPRRAGVSSFGLGGTNVHVVLEEAPATETSDPVIGPQLLCLSAKTAAALDKATINLATHLQQHPDINLADVAYTLQTGRREFSHRRAVVCENVVDAIKVLESSNSPRLVQAVCEPGEHSLVFMFSGQGAQYPNMGLGLYQNQAVFRDTVDSCCEILRPMLGLDLCAVIYPDNDADDESAELLTQTELTQPALFVIEYALAKLWMSFGIQASAMIGHSLGEYVAACLAGVMSLEDALKLVSVRGHLMGQLPAGAMLAVPLTESELEPLLNENLSLAAVNSPGMSVVSGSVDAIDALETQLSNKGLEPGRLHTSHAFHSPMMDPIIEPFTEMVKSIRLSPPSVPYVSNVTGDWISAEQATDPDYYARHLRQPVLFAKGIMSLCDDSNYTLLEVGPGQTLTSLVRRHPGKSDKQEVVSSMRHPRENRDDNVFFMESMGHLWLSGVCPDWAAVHSGSHRKRVVLPTYPFERVRYWLEAAKQLPVAQGRPKRRVNPSEWMYLPSWRRVPVPAPAKTTAQVAANWLCFIDQCGLGEQLAVELSELGCKLVIVAAGEEFSRQSENIYTLNPASREDYDRLVDELVSQSMLPEVIVHLWSVAANEIPKQDENSYREIQQQGFFSLVYLLQALDSIGFQDALKLAVITSQVHEVNGDEILCPDRAMALAPCKVIAMEYPHIQARSIDVVVKDSNDIADFLGHALVTELCAPWNEPVVAYRGRYRWTQAFEQLSVAELADTPSRLRQSGVYLITGGLGGVGHEIANYLARSVAAKLVLVGRTVMPAKLGWADWLATHDESDFISRRIHRIQALESLGASVLLCQADVADQQQMADVIARAEDNFGALHGVVHAAGAEKSAVSIHSLQQENCVKQFLPRLQGLRVLEHVLKGKPLDFCVVTSSLASIMGVHNFVSYTAAHIFMDAFVYQQNQRNHIPWMSINWDNWNINHTGDEKNKQGVTEFYIEPAEGVDIFERLLSLSDTSQVMVSSGDLQARVDQWIRVYGSQEKGDANDIADTRSAHPRPDLATEYEAPGTDVENTLASIWQEMLGLDQIGIHDNFFELGGDSVINIQICARANQVGLKLTPKQVFEFQTVHELANAAGTETTVTAEQSAIKGEILLTPVQYWLFERQLPNVNHFNLPIMLRLNETIDTAVLEKTMTYLVNHHDVLRIRYVEQAGVWTQINDDVIDHFEIETIDISDMEFEQQSAQIEMIANQAQCTLDIISGPLFRVIYINTGSQAKPVLILIAHHLIIDVVSWRILLEDIQTCYLLLKNNETPQLPQKTTSFQYWSKKLNDYAQSTQTQSALDYWKPLTERQFTPLPLDHVGDNSTGSTETIFVELDEEETRILLTALPAKYDVGISDLLVYALTKAICNWIDNDAVLLNLEGHGREPLFDDIDITRTVGWFTSIYPVCFEINKKYSAKLQIKAIHQQVKAVPLNGMVYGLLRYLNKTNKCTEVMSQLSPAQISFLYMGQFDQSFANDSLYTPATESEGLSHDPTGTRGHVLEINSLIKFGKFIAGWSFSKNLHESETIKAIANDFISELKNLISQIVSETDAKTKERPCEGLSTYEKEKLPEKKYTSKSISQDDLAEILRQNM